MPLVLSILNILLQFDVRLKDHQFGYPTQNKYLLQRSQFFLKFYLNLRHCFHHMTVYQLLYRIDFLPENFYPYLEQESTLCHVFRRFFNAEYGYY